MNSLVTIAVYNSVMEAEVARDYLLSAGIHAFLLNDHVVSANMLWTTALGGVKIQVSPADEAEACRLLDEVKAERQKAIDLGPVVFKCSQCNCRQQFPGERRGRIESCTECGAFIDVPDQSDDSLTVELAESAEQGGNQRTTNSTKPRIPIGYEILAVLGFMYFPHLINAFVGMSETYYGYAYSSYDLIYLFTKSMVPISAMILILFLLGEDLSRFGLVKPRWLLDTVLGIAIWFVLHVFTTVNLQIISVAFDPTYASYGDQIEATGALGVMLCIVAFTANSVAEELCMRGYLITRLNDYWNNRVWAVLVSAILFGSYHLYQGWIMGGLITMQGVILGASFVLIKRIWPLIIAHTILNLWTVYNL